MNYDKIIANFRQKVDERINLMHLYDQEEEQEWFETAENLINAKSDLQKATKFVKESLIEIIDEWANAGDWGEDVIGQFVLAFVEEMFK